MSDKFDNFISFVNGNTGIYAIASVIYDTIGDHGKALQYIKKVNEVFNKPITDKIDYDDGIPGFLYALDFLETYYGK